MKALPSELKSCKEEFDFNHKKIGELEWELATIFLGRKAVPKSEIDMIESQLENYRSNAGIVLEKVRKEISNINHSS